MERFWYGDGVALGIVGEEIEVRVGTDSERLSLDEALEMSIALDKATRALRTILWTQTR